MKITVEMSDVVKAVDRFVKQVGCQYIDISNVNYDELLKAVQDEYNCGCDGSVIDIIHDLNDSVGLDEFGIHFTD